MKALAFSAALAFALVACSGSKQYFSPANAERYEHKSSGEIKSLDKIISTSNYSFKSDAAGNLRIKNAATGYEKSLKFDAQIASAAITGNLLACTDALNNVMLYDLAREQMLFKQNLGASYGVISPLPEPVFTQALALLPSLDGRLVVLNYNTASLLRVINVGTKEFFNNLIYIATTDNSLVAISASKALSIVGDKTFSLLDEFKAAASDSENLYFFTASGDVIRTDYSLHELARTNYEYASFKAASLQNGYLYALEFSGKLLKLDAQTLEAISIWDFGKKLSSASAFLQDQVVINSKIYPLK